MELRFYPWLNLYIIKDDNGKLWVEMITSTFLDAVATVDVLTASNNDVDFVEAGNRVFCMDRRFERINKVDRDFSYWQILCFVCPLALL